MHIENGSSQKFTDCNSFWKIHCFHFFLQKSLCYQIWPCRKIGHGQPRVIVLTNYDGLESPIVHTKFRGDPSTGFGEEDLIFEGFFTMYGRGRHLGHLTQMPRTKVCFLPKKFPRKSLPYPRRLHIKFGFERPCGFRENTFEIVDADGRRITEHAVGILKAQLWAFGSGELKIVQISELFKHVGIPKPRQKRDNFVTCGSNHFQRQRSLDSSLSLFSRLQWKALAVL